MRVVKEHEERRNEILDTAESLFISKSYEKTTINDILKSIGIAKGTFYHYFKSKEEVMDAVIIRIVQHEVEAVKKIVEDKQLKPFEKLMTFFLSQSANPEDTKSQLSEQFQYTENAFMKQRSLERTIEYICPILAEVIEEGNKTGEFNTAYPLESIQFLTAGIQTLLDSRIVSEGHEDPQQRIQSLITVIFRVLGVNETKINMKDMQQQLNKVLSK
ncbi:TetR/AcrR family transcriptional regulator [Breznakia pachnodae]|uniref:AcrR family transcriptional regulator n=1 Tax=Breznakia pachnodae TaxID=265178 RepID=A0ABU0E1B2_9FIRM|nr:TetR/AcrR family transcriptional regulator [Breznakia pachnodae]MDQ0360655.1 AcrR family transcriptional regulator [Breznakia pachnodae]